MTKLLTKSDPSSLIAKSNGESTAEQAMPALDFGHAWDYAPAPEATDSITIAPRYELFIGGKWQSPKSGKYFATISPSTEARLSEVADAGAEDVDDAVRAARTGYERYWSKLRPSERAKYLFRIARAIQ